MNEEAVLEQFVLKNKEQTTIPDTSKQSEIGTVEQKARESGKPLASTVLQKRSVLSDSALEKKIASSLHAHVGTLDEKQLRENVADHLDKHQDQITEAEYAGIENKLLATSEQEQAKQQQKNASLISPPPFVADTVGNLQDKTQALADRASGFQTPGGIGLLIGVLLFFIWVIVPVSGGKTRMQLLWGILTGQVELSQKYRDAEKTAESVRGGGADFNTNGVIAGGGADFTPTAINRISSYDVSFADYGV